MVLKRGLKTNKRCALLAASLLLLILPANATLTAYAEEPDPVIEAEEDAVTDTPVETLPAKETPAEADAPDADPVNPDPAEADPIEADPTVPDPVETNPDVTDPGEADPAEADPVEADPSVTGPAKTNPAETDPMDANPPEDAPVSPDPEAEEILAFIEAEEIWVDGTSLPGGSEDARFEEYVNRVLYGEEPASPTKMRALNASRRPYLTEAGKALYDALRNDCIRIASGSATNTRLLYTVSDVLPKTTYTYKELGLSKGADAKAIKAALFGSAEGYRQIVGALLADMPCELYWLDKTSGWRATIPAMTLTSTGVRITSDSSIGCSFAVAAAYSETGATGTFVTKASVTGAATAAKNKALAIVAQHSAEDDYTKLVSYRDEICKLTGYNNSVDKNTPYGDPWQLIYVFDNDPSTEVVCEGYSKAFQLLCDLSSFQSYRIACYTVTGNVSFSVGGGGGHMWNTVRMDNGWNYLVDVTNSDAGTTGNDNLFLKGASVSTPTTFTVEGSVYTYDTDALSLYSEAERLLSTGTSYLNDVGNGLQPAADIPVKGIAINKASATLVTGDTLALAEEVLPKNATNRRVFWSSTNPAVATVDDYGFVTAVSRGNTTITVESEEGGFTASCGLSVVDIPAESVSLNQTGIRVIVGNSVSLNASVLPANVTLPGVTWSSSNTAVASVSQNGVVSTKTTGTAVIRATSRDGRKYAECTVTVVPVPVSGVTLNRSDATLSANHTLQLVATVAPANAGNRSVSWASSNPSVATVDGNGLVLGRAAGTATITVKTADGAKTASCTVSVVNVAVSRLTLNMAKSSLPAGATLQLVPGIVPDNASNKGITWTSSNKNVASVDANGLVRAKKKGTVTITAKATGGKKTAKCKITVTVPVKSVKVNRQSCTLDKGKTLKLKATVSPSNANQKKVTWSVQDPSVATVSSSGKITAKKSGTTVVTVTTIDGAKTATCRITVKTPVKKTRLTKKSATLQPGNTLQLNAVLTPADADNPALTWKSSKSSVVSVSPQGVVTAHKKGKAVITVTSVDGKKKATCKITVK